MSTFKLTPSAYYVSSSATVYNPGNMYTSTDSTSFSQVNIYRGGLFILKQFDFNNLPSEIAVDSFTIRIRIKNTASSSYTTPLKLYSDNSTTISGTPSQSSIPSDQTTTISFSGTDDFNTIRGYGDSFGIGMTATSQYSFQVYGADIVVDYHIPDPNHLYFKNNGSWVEASKAYKKINGVWVEQSDLTAVFSSGVNYVRGN